MKLLYIALALVGVVTAIILFLGASYNTQQSQGQLEVDEHRDDMVMFKQSSKTNEPGEWMQGHGDLNRTSPVNMTPPTGEDETRRLPRPGNTTLFPGEPLN